MTCSRLAVVNNGIYSNVKDLLKTREELDVHGEELATTVKQSVTFVAKSNLSFSFSLSVDVCQII